jgi:lipopolysaccharide export system permease protein
MRIIKRLHWFVLKSFLPLFAMTFFIVLFIVLMQFLWKYVDDLVGKGLDISVIAELFFYAAVSMVPMSLPLAILLASLMTFGNLGEKFELTAMKASGISLVRVMAPLIILIGSISIGAFFFQNNVLPTAQVKMWTLLFSMRQKSPEVEIPEGVFYDQIPGYNLFVTEKDQQTGVLRDIMIYDVARGAENATILLADSAQLAFTKDSKYLYLHLFKGEEFENLRDQQVADQNVPFRREEFADKQILIPFDANFNRMDDQGMRKQYVGKNIDELHHTIDSVNRRLDSVGDQYATQLRMMSYGGVRPNVDSKTHKPKPYKDIQLKGNSRDLDSLLNAMGKTEASRVYDDAMVMARNKAEEYQYKSANMADDLKSVRRHEIELIKKFTLSVACLIFFFIGAPLGAIIRKGGIGTPLVISVLLFLVYYIIDNTGYKMARDGHWNVYIGMWLSTVVLAPLGIFATIKAMNDSVLFDKDAIMNLLRRVLGLRRKRGSLFKEVIINDIDMGVAHGMLLDLKDMASKVLAEVNRPMGYMRYWLMGVNQENLAAVSEMTDHAVEYLSDCRDKAIVAELQDYPIVSHLWIYHPVPKRWMSYTCMALFPIGITVWIAANFQYRRLRNDMKRIIKVSDKICSLDGINSDESASPSQADIATNVEPQ